MSFHSAADSVFSRVFDRRASARTILHNSDKIICHINDKNPTPVTILSFSAEGLSVLLPKTSQAWKKDSIILDFIIEVDSKICEGKIHCKVHWKQLSSDGIVLGMEIEKSELPLQKLITENFNTIFTKHPDRRGNETNNLVDILLKRRENDRDEWVSYPVDIANVPEYRRFLKERRSNAREEEKPITEAGRRKHRPDPGVRKGFITQSIKSAITVLRDLLIYILPIAINKLLVGKGSFAFIAHPRNFADVTRMFPFAKWIPESAVKLWFRYQWPFIASRIIKRDDNNAVQVKGWLLICPLWAEHMMKDTDLAREKIQTTVRLAEKLGCQVAGLGAFTSIVTHDGMDLLGKSNIGITTGNSFSAAIAVMNLSHAFKLSKLDMHEAKVAIVGAAGSVGSGCSRVLHGNVKELLIIDINERTLNTLYDELSQNEKLCRTTKISKSKSLEDVKNYDGVIVVTNAIRAIINEEHLKNNAVVIDCAQPKNVSYNVPKIRKDVIVIESAIVRVPGLECDFDLDVNRGEALGCMAESMILGAIGKRRMMLGKVTAEQVKDIYSVALDLGIQLAYFRNSSGFVAEEVIFSNHNN